MNENIESADEETGAEGDARAAIVAADDTGLLQGEMRITQAELTEGEVTPTE